MKVEQYNINSLEDLPQSCSFEPNIILVFTTLEKTSITPYLKKLKSNYPNTSILGCSTVGNIFDNKITNQKISLSLIEFEKSSLKIYHSKIDEKKSSYENAKDFQSQFEEEGLKHILLFTTSPINGSNYLKGFQDNLQPNIKVTGGMSAMEEDFTKNYVIYEGEPQLKCAIGIGIYGEGTKISYGSNGGWDSFGMERIVTKSSDNILYELDGKNALNLYKSYLGEMVHKLPDIGVMFPISLRISENKTPIVRSVMGIDNENQALIFGGDIPTNSSVKLMKANVDRLISGAEKSALISTENKKIKPNLAILISCRGRLGVLKQLAEEELEIVREVLGNQTYITGFYSDGEFAPANKQECSVLHNQTMTITTFTE